MKKYFIKTTVVAIAFAMATTLALGHSKIDSDQFCLREKKSERVYERMIAHGGGTVQGFDTSSSVDAIMHSIENGFKIIELDMEFSYDDKIIMLHDWDRTVATYLGRKFDNKLTQDQFNKQLICGKFEPLTFDKLIKILDKNPQVRIVTDTKGDNIKLLTTIAQKYPDYVDCMIPQIYDYSEFERVSELGYKDIIFTLYKQDTIDYDKFLNFIKNNNIYAVTVGKDYWVKDLPQKLKLDGVVVYTHPVYTVEEAKQQFSEGACGIYSSTLIPSEIEGYDFEYYLIQTDKNGRKVKLVDASLGQNDVRTIKIHGDMSGKGLKYKLDGKALEQRLLEVEDSPSEVHELTIEIWDMHGISIENTSQPLYIMKYLLTKNEGKIRILSYKYDYRLKILKQLPKFDEVMQLEEKKKSLADIEIVKVLSQSFIAKAGKYYYYNNGRSGRYYVGDELMSPQKSVGGNVMVPLAETVKQLGASNITMDSKRYVYIAMNDVKTISQVYSKFIRKDTYNTRIVEPISLYRSKVVAGGEVISVVSDRNFVDESGLLIILPKNCEISKEKVYKLIVFADLLYKE